jgi:hypothetical protein
MLSESLQQYLDQPESESQGSQESIENESTEEVSTSEASNEKTEVEEAKGEKSLEDKLKDLDSEKEIKEEGTSNDLLSQLASLGITRKGLPVEFGDIEQVKEVLSKGFDYTIKTQELSEERKKFDEEKVNFENEFKSKLDEVESYRSQLDDKVVENEIMAGILQDLKSQDSDLFQLIAESFNKKMSEINFQKNNPIVQSLNKKVTELEKSLTQKQSIEQESKLKDIASSWEKGVQEVSSQRANQFKKLGIKPDWNKVQDHWKADVTGKLSVDQALLAVHGQEIVKALENFEKNKSVKAKSQNRVGPEKKVETKKEEQPNTGNYLKDLERIASKFNY